MKIGKELGMKESYGEGLADPDPVGTASHAWAPVRVSTKR